MIKIIILLFKKNIKLYDLAQRGGDRIIIKINNN